MIIATVYWFDSAVCRPLEWLDKDDIIVPLVMMSSGILKREGKDGVELAKDYNPESKDYRGVSIIPRCNILKVIKHKVKKP